MEKPAVIAPDRYILYPCFPPLLLFPMQEIHSPSSWQCHPPLNRTLKLYQNHRTRVKGSPLSRKIPQLPEVKLFGSSNQRIARRSNSRCLQCPANADFQVFRGRQPDFPQTQSIEIGTLPLIFFTVAALSRSFSSMPRCHACSSLKKKKEEGRRKK